MYLKVYPSLYQVLYSKILGT